MRLLGVDFGFKRIGLAIAETAPEVITARPFLDASGTLKTDAARIAELAKREEIDAIVIGLPVEESGEEGRMARICRTVARHLIEAGFRVEVVDERYTSIEAEANLRNLHPLTPSPSRHKPSGQGRGNPESGSNKPSGKGKGDSTAAQRRKLKDGEAARLILERFIHEQKIG
jgi:putative transcription antitermination factor YqgF